MINRNEIKISLLDVQSLKSKNFNGYLNQLRPDQVWRFAERKKGAKICFR